MNGSRVKRQTQQSRRPIDIQHQIPIVLAEYSAREQEKNSAAQGILNGLALAVALLLGLVGVAQREGFSSVWLIVPIGVLVFLMMETDRQFSVLYHSMYIGLLEERLNHMADTQLLQWERFGSSFHTLLGKPRLHDRKTGATLFNWGLVVQIVYVLLVCLYLVGLYRAPMADY
jgi:hypothetical protein